MSDKFPSPLRYPGGKARVFPFFHQLMYSNDLIGIDYAEPYAGGGGLALRLLYGGYVNRIFLNDLDPVIACIWRAFLDHTEEFCLWLNRVDITVDMWRHCRSVYESKDCTDSLEVAKAAFFLNRTSVSGVLKGSGIIGGYEQKGKSKIDARFNRQLLCKKIRKVAEFGDRIFFYNEDASRFVRRVSKRRSAVFLYLDPPYVQKGSDLYLNHYGNKEHERVCAMVSRLSGPWVVSYDVTDLVMNLYLAFPKLVYKLRQNTSNRLGDEVLIPSPCLDFQLAAKELAGAKALLGGEDMFA